MWHFTYYFVRLLTDWLTCCWLTAATLLTNKVAYILHRVEGHVAHCPRAGDVTELVATEMFNFQLVEGESENTRKVNSNKRWLIDWLIEVKKRAKERIVLREIHLRTTGRHLSMGSHSVIYLSTP